MENMNLNESTPQYSNGPIASSDPVGVRKESWKEMLDHLSQDLSLLWEKQSRLMQVELEEKVGAIKAASGSLAGSGAFMLVGVFCLATTAIFALSLVVPAWAAAGIVTIAFFLIGGVLAAIAMKKLSAEKLKPKRSIETFEDITMTLKERYNEFRHH
jgi:hypothetical protein